MAIKFEDVSFCYDKEKYIFSHLDFQLPEKGFLVLLGKSGSGKTTFLSLLKGELVPTEGKITGNEKDMQMVYQSPLLLDYLSVKENILLPLTLSGKDEKYRQERLKKVLEQVHLEGFEEKEPDTLSGGEKMRVSIARALSKEESVLILDEPTGQLDEENSKDIYKLLKEISQTTLVLLVTHDEKNGTMLSDSIYLLEEGKLIPKKKKDQEEETITKTKEKENQGKIPMKDSLFLLSKYLNRHPLRVFLSTFFLAFSLTILYLGLNLYHNIHTGLNTLLFYHYNSNIASFSLKEEVADSGNMKLSRYSIPDKTTLHNLKIENSYPCLEYFLPSYNEINVKKEYCDIRFEPVWKENKSKLLIGRGMKDEEDIVVNRLFLKTFSLSEDEALDRQITFSRSTLIYSTQFKATDMIQLDFSFRIRGISKESSTFNEPILYYNYSKIKDKIGNTVLPNLSKEREKETTIDDLFDDEDYLEEDFLCQKTLIESDDIFQLKKDIETKYPGKTRIESKTLSIKESVDQIVSSLIKIGAVFLFLVLLSAFMLEFIAVYSLYDENIRLFALVTSFSRNIENRIRITLSNGLCFFFYTLSQLFVLSSLLSLFIRLFSKHNSLPDFLALFDPLSFLFVLLITLTISIPASLLPLRKIKTKNIKKELEGED